MSRRRLDAELVRRGLVAGRTEAEGAIRAGSVTVNGAPATDAASLVAADQSLHVSTIARPFASRGGVKLDAALSRFDVDPSGSMCLDAGASTGGFTDRLLQGGAARVAAVDVGYGQLAWELRSDPRVTVLERTNIRIVTIEMLGFAPALVVADLSFVSLGTVAPALASVATVDATFVVLVKPQFEAGAAAAAGGVVRDPAVWRRVLERTVSAFERVGVSSLGSMASPIMGPAGNVEFLLHARKGGPPPRDVDIGAAVDRAVAEGETIQAGRSVDRVGQGLKLPNRATVEFPGRGPGT